MKLAVALADGLAKKIPPDNNRAQSLIKASQKTLSTAQRIPFDQNSLQSIIRELYEALRQHCEALGYLHGYKFSTHEPISGFLEEILKEPSCARSFDRYRKLRNGINYYGDDVAPETVKDALLDIPKIINTLKKHEK